MDEFLKRFLLSLTSFAVMAALGYFLVELSRENFLTNEERDVAASSDALLKTMNQKWQRDIQQLSQHEAQIASSVVHSSTGAGFDAVGGHEQLKRDLLLHVAVPLRHAKTFFSRQSLRPPSGILLEGAPGCGKTMIANALAHEAGVPFIPLLLSDVESKWNGESQKLLKAVFTLAKKLQPCIIWIDEIDGFLRERSELDSSHDYGMKCAMLQLMDQAKRDRIVVLAATNNSRAVDGAVRRRLPRRYTVGLPDARGRAQIIKRLARDEGGGKLEWLTEATEGMTGADITEVFHAACAYRNETLASQLMQQPAGRISMPPLSDAHWEHGLALFGVDVVNAEEEEEVDEVAAEKAFTEVKA